MANALHGDWLRVVIVVSGGVDVLGGGGVAAVVVEEIVGVLIAVIPRHWCGAAGVASSVLGHVPALSLALETEKSRVV